MSVAISGNPASEKVIVMRLIFPILTLLAMASAASAQEKPFFQGKTVNLIIAGTAGGGLDLSARIVVRYLPRFLQGHPTMVGQLMPGAGGIRAVEFMSSTAAQDGSSLIILPPGPILEPLIGARKTSYRMVEFQALGAISRESSICAAWHATKFKTIEDARISEMIVAGTGAGSSTDLYPMVMNDILGTRFRVITGFQGSQESSLAIERGEVDGRCGWGWTSLKSTNSNWIKDKKLKILMQFGLTRNRELLDVPLALELAETDEARQMMRLLFAPLMLNKPVFAPPRTPQARIDELRCAFSQMMADQAFREEVIKASGEEPNPTHGVEAQKIMEDIYQTPTPIIDRLKKSGTVT